MELEDHVTIAVGLSEAGFRSEQKSHGFQPKS